MACWGAGETLRPRGLPGTINVAQVPPWPTWSLSPDAPGPGALSPARGGSGGGAGARSRAHGSPWFRLPGAPCGSVGRARQELLATLDGAGEKAESPVLRPAHPVSPTLRGLPGVLLPGVMEATEGTQGRTVCAGCPRSHLVPGLGKRVAGQVWGAPHLFYSPHCLQLAPLGPRVPHRCGPRGLASSHIRAFQRTSKSQSLPGEEKPSRQHVKAAVGGASAEPCPRPHGTAGPGTHSESLGFQPRSVWPGSHAAWLQWS